MALGDIKTERGGLSQAKSQREGEEAIPRPLLKPLLATADSQVSDCILVPGRRNYPFGETGS